MIIPKDGSSAFFNIALEKGREIKGKQKTTKNYYNTGYSNLVAPIQVHVLTPPNRA